MKTFELCLFISAASAAVIAPVFAQTSERRATIRGGENNDSGKCTIEVYIDGAADVEIHGDRGFLRTLSGQPAQWRRFECSGPIPTNPAEFRFTGIDGRGRQALVQDPGNGRGAAIVRIEDTAGGAEGYTFDLEWRGGGSGSGSGRREQPQQGGMGRAPSPGGAARACEDAVRERANQEYGFRDITFSNLNAQDNPGRNDTIVGSFEARRGADRNSYRFSCAVDFASGRVRGVEIRGRDAGPSGSTSACERAAEERIQSDGYRNVRFGWGRAGGSRDNRLAGTATAQRGNNGRAYGFDINCHFDPENGSIQSVQATRR